MFGVIAFCSFVVLRVRIGFLRSKAALILLRLRSLGFIRFGVFRLHKV